MKIKIRVRLLFIIIQILNVIDYSNTYKILGLFTTPIQSHLQTHVALVDSLVKRGHNVTMVTSLPVSVPKGTHRHIHLHLAGFREKYLQIFSQAVKKPIYFNMFDIFLCMIDHSAACIEHTAMKDLMLKEDSFDLVILGYIMTELQLGIAAHFKCPVIVVWVNQSVKKINDITGNPMEVSYVPLMWTGRSQPMNFFNRVENYLNYLAEFPRDLYLYYYTRNLFGKLFPWEQYPSYDEALQNVSMVFLNHHFSQNLIKPNLPAVVDIGGVHIKDKPDILPKNIQQFLNNNPEKGIIYLSLGTSVKMSNLGIQVTESMYNVLSKLSQNVIWKWDSDQVPGNASNILFQKWLPQDDLLANPKMRLFITHGGFSSITEAQHHGIPIIGIPFFGDQYANLNNAADSGWARIVQLNTINEEIFRDAIVDVLTNSSYKDSVLRASNLFRDRPMSPKETAMYWIEYVIRHRGAQHLQNPAVFMNGFSYYSVDVIVFILFLLSLIYMLFKVVLIFIWNCIKHSRKTKQKTH